MLINLIGTSGEIAAFVAGVLATLGALVFVQLVRMRHDGPHGAGRRRRRQ